MVSKAIMLCSRYSSLACRDRKASTFWSRIASSRRSSRSSKIAWISATRSIVVVAAIVVAVVDGVVSVVVVGTRSVVGGAVAGDVLVEVHPPVARATATNPIVMRFRMLYTTLRIGNPALKGALKQGFPAPVACPAAEQVSAVCGAETRDGRMDVLRAIIVVPTLLLAASVYLMNFGLWMRTEVVDPEAFTTSALESFGLPGSYDAIGDIVADKVVDEYPVLAFVRSNLAALLGSLLATEPFEPALVMIAEDVHDRLFGDVRSAVVIDLSDYEDVVLEGLARTAPGVVSLLPSAVFRQYTIFDADKVPDLSGDIHRISLASMFATASALAAIVLLVVMVRPWSAAAIPIGIALVLAALVTLLVKPITAGLMRVTVTDEALQVLAVNLFEVSSRSLVVRALAIGVVGLALLIVGLVTGVHRRRVEVPA